MTTAKSDVTAVRARVAGVSAQIVANQPAVTTWVQRYFGSWWQAEQEPVSKGTDADVHVLAHVDATRFDTIAAAVDDVPHETIDYARTELRLARTGGAVVAYGADGVGYTVTDGSIGIAGTSAGKVASAACRLAREAIRGRLARDGWVLLHASAVVRAGQAYLAFGGKGAGKTATALQLAHAKRWALLANDRVFARLTPAGRVMVLPWPAAAAVGLGLLAAVDGWYETVAAARDELHSSTTTAVQIALARGLREPVRGEEREHKAQLYPDQLASLLGLDLVPVAEAAAVLFPTVSADATPRVEQGGREVGIRDVFAGHVEDRYPNVFGLRQPEPDTARETVLAALNELPRATVTLGHNVVANAEVLAGIR